MKPLYIDIYTYIIVCMYIYIYINNILYYINKYILIIYIYIIKP